MTARLLDGRAIAAAIRESVLPDVHAFTARAGRPPGLGIVLVGEDPSSEIYVRNKVRAGTESGLRVDLNRLPADATLSELLSLVRAAECERRARRDSRAVAVAGGDGEGGGAESVRCDRPLEGRRWLPSASTSASWCRGART